MHFARAAVRREPSRSGVFGLPARPYANRALTATLKVCTRFSRRDAGLRKSAAPQRS